jgi:iron complex outermembrane receptor protein
MLCRRPLASRVFRVQSLAYLARGIACVLALLATTAALRAQNVSAGVIEGRVQHSDAGTYLNNARVRVTGTNREAFTNEAGEYRLADVPAGPATLDVFYTGMPSQRVTVVVPSGGVVQQDFNLTRQVVVPGEERVVKLDKFVVAADRETNAAAIAINEQRFAPTRRDVVSTDAFGEINQGNIGEFVKFLPGISLDVKDGNTPSGIMIRGFDPNYTNVTMDGGQLASTLIANTQTSSRQFVLEGMNINNIARIEVTKLPTPDMSANVLGGAVNFVSKSAFERSRQELRLSAYLSANAKAINLNKSPGPFDESTYKVLPSFDLSFVHPVTKNFGYVVTAQQASQFYLQNKSVIGYRFTSAGATVTNPYVTNVNTSFAPNRTDRTSGGVTFDFKPWDRHVLKLNLQVSAQRQQNASRTLNYSVGGAQPVSWNPHNTIGGTTGTTYGSAGLSTSFQSRHALMRMVSGEWNFIGNAWNIETAASYSNSNNRPRDTARGFFRSVSVNLPNVRTVNLENIDTTAASFGNATVLGVGGVRIDENKLANYNLTSAASEGATSVDEVREARVNVTRMFTLWNAPVAVKFGGSVNDMTRDAKYQPISWTYVGPDRIASSGDEGLANYVSAEDLGVSPGFGRPAPEWPDPFKIYQDFKANPSWWTQTVAQGGDMPRNYAIRSPWFHEKITAGYAMADTKLINGRLRLVGGVRYELTEDEGKGYRQNLDDTFVKDAQGNIVYTTNPTTGVRTGVIRPELGATNSYEYNAVLYTYRSYYNARKYHYYHPSLSATFNITDNLLLRAAYAKTIGRPNLSDIVPNLYVAENLNFGVSGQSSSSIPGYITGANIGLRPWTAKNYDYSIEYYLPRNGMLMFNWYRKDITDFFSSVNILADQALLEQLGLDSGALGYQYTRRFNVADARITGWEARIDFPLANLANTQLVAGIGKGFLTHFTLTANFTHLDLSGSRITASDWKRYIPRSRNLGLSYRFPKLTGNVFLNWRGRMLRDTSSNFPGASEYIRARYQLDASMEYQLTKRFSIFFAGRNLLNAPSQWEVSGPIAPAWSSLTNYEDYGAQYSLGMRGLW